METQINSHFLWRFYVYVFVPKLVYVCVYTWVYVCVCVHLSKCVQVCAQFKVMGQTITLEAIP